MASQAPAAAGGAPRTAIGRLGGSTAREKRHPISAAQVQVLQSQMTAYDRLVESRGKQLKEHKIPPGEPQYRATELRLTDLKVERERMAASYSAAGLRLLGAEASPSIQSQIRVRQLRLLPLQTRLRAESLQLFRGWFGENAVNDYLSPKNKKFLKEIAAHAKRRKKEHDDNEKRRAKQTKQFFAMLDTHADTMSKTFQRHRKHSKIIPTAVTKWHAAKVRDDAREADRLKRQRLKALKDNDEEAYMQLVKDTKDTRIKHLIQETQQFLLNLESKLQLEKQTSAEFGGAVKTLAGSGDSGGTEPGAATPRTAGARFNSAAHSTKESITEQPKSLVGGTLKPYQKVGLEWMVSLYNNDLNGILADEMGLGKTIQTIALLTYLTDVKQNPGPFLVVVPLSVLPNWIIEFDQWAPSLKVVTYKGPNSVRKRIYAEHMSDSNFNVVITTYEYIIKGKAVLKKFNWQYIIIDEGHRIKNSASKLALVLGQEYSSRHRILLTGTPLQNNLQELWSLLNFLLPRIFNSSASFESWFNEPFAAAGGSAEQAEINEEEQLLVIDRFHKILRPFLLRRLKSEVAKDLPQKVETVVKCELSGWQKILYKQLKDQGLRTVDGHGQVSSRHLSNLVMQLRKCCNHPYLLNQVDYLAPEKVISSSGKFELLDRMLPKLKATEHKVLIFTQMTKVLDIMQDYLFYKQYPFLRLDGSTHADDRAKMVADFHDQSLGHWIFLLTTRAGGLGLNLQGADTVIIYDSDWNPQMDLQAMDRAHRIGQTSEVKIFRLITNTPVETEMLARATQKLQMDEQIIQSAMFNNNHSAAEEAKRQERLRQLVEADGAGDKEDAEPEEEETAVVSWEVLNRLLARSDDEFQLFQKMDEALKQHEAETRQPRLMTEKDCPKWMNEPQPVAPEVDMTAHGRGHREKKDVRYTGMNEREFNKLLDGKGETTAAQENKESRKKGQSNGKKSKAGAAATPLTCSAPIEVQREMMMAAWKTVRRCKDQDQDNRERADLFREVPSRDLYPDYYQLIREPISLKEIKERIKQGSYSSLEAFQADMHLMFTNAMTYNVEGSWVYVDAQVMKREFDKKLRQLVSKAADGSKVGESNSRPKLVLSLGKRSRDGEAGPASLPTAKKQKQKTKLVLKKT